VVSFLTEAVEALVGVVSDAGGVGVTEVISLAARVDASVASIEISAFLFSHAAMCACDTLVDILASWLAVQRMDASSVAVRVALVETLEHADVFIAGLTSTSVLGSLRLDDRANASPSAWLVDTDLVGVDFVSAFERAGSVNAVVVRSSENAVADIGSDALVNVEAVSRETENVSFIASLARTEGNVFLGGIDGTFTSLAVGVVFSAVHGIA